MDDHRPAVQLREGRLPIRVYKPVPRQPQQVIKGTETSRVVADKGGPPFDAGGFTRCALCGEQVDMRKLKAHESNCLKGRLIKFERPGLEQFGGPSAGPDKEQ